MNVDPCIDDLWKVSADWSGPLEKNFSARAMVWNDDILIVFFFTTIDLSCYLFNN